MTGGSRHFQATSHTLHTFQSKGGTMRRLFVPALALAMLLAVPAAAEAQPVAERTDIVQEHNFDGTPADDPADVGKAMLVRRGHSLSAVASVVSQRGQSRTIVRSGGGGHLDGASRRSDEEAMFDAS